MSSTNISIDPDQAAISVSKLADGQEVASYVSARVASHGVGVGATSDFKDTLNKYVEDIQNEMVKLRDKLEALQTDVTQTIVSIGEQDSKLADESTKFAQNIDAAATSTGANSATPHGATAPLAAGATTWA